MDVTVIGHGSLMSGLGLSASGTFQAREACIVALGGCRRGFAKLSRYGDRFATDLELVRLPVEGQVVSPESAPDGKVEALGLTVSLDDVKRLAKREGYSPEAVQKLAEMAQAQELEIAEFLWHLDTTVGHDLVRYRHRLFALTGFTSAHYIPHPVRLAGTRYALIFLAPGFEGTGSDAVVSIRAQTGMRTVMGASETWQKKPTNDQLVYFLSCLLGGVHGIWVRDLLPTLNDGTRLVRDLISCLKPGVEEERERFLSATGLSRERYHRTFGEATAALVRSGLEDFLKRDAAR